MSSFSNCARLVRISTQRTKSDKEIIMNRTIKLIPATALLLTLSACATFIEGAQQQIEFETTGAENAICLVQTGASGMKYQVRPPQTIWIKKSSDDMNVVCEAPGNRTATTHVESSTAGKTYLNIFNLGFGAGYDGESGAMFKYPEKVVIDFTGVMPQAEALPAYHNLDGLDPKHEGTIEDLGPDQPAMKSDANTNFRHKMAEMDAEREAAAEAAFEAEKQSRIDSVEGGFYGDKGNSK